MEFYGAFLPNWLGNFNLTQALPNLPLTQYGVATGSGAKGNLTVTLSTAYHDTNYNVQVTHSDATAGANITAVINSVTTFTIYWDNAKAGSQPFFWFTIGQGTGPVGVSQGVGATGGTGGTGPYGI